MDIAITRDIPQSILRCELTHLHRGEPIDYARAVAQHEAYCQVLSELGCRCSGCPPMRPIPDCPFVEDTAVVLDELAILASPGVVSRRGGDDHRAHPQPLSPAVAHRAAGDAGGRRCWWWAHNLRRQELAHQRRRIAALAKFVGYFGYRVAHRSRRLLALKSAVTALDSETVL